MANDPSAARDAEPDAPSEEDFQAFLVALSGSARGRAFLAEHARRSRNEDSATLLSAVQRLESLVLSQTPPPAAESPSNELRGMLETIRSVQAELDVSMLAAQVANLAALIQNVQERIETMVAPAEPAPPQDVPLQDAPRQDAAAEPIALDKPTPFDTDVPPQAETDAEPEAVLAESEAGAALEAGVAELPVPEALSFDDSAPTEPIPEAMPEDAWPAIPEVAWCDSESAADGAAVAEEARAETIVEAPALDQPAVEEAASEQPAAQDAPIEDAPVETAAVEEAPVVAAESPVAAAAPPAGLAIAALVETLAVPAADASAEPPEATVIKAGTIPPPTPFAGEDFARPRTMPPEIDPLADIKALSDEERVALFT